MLSSPMDARHFRRIVVEHSIGAIPEKDGG